MKKTLKGIKENFKKHILRGAIIIAFIIALAFFLISDYQSDKDKTEILEAIKNCAQSVEENSLSGCAQKFGLSESQINILAKNIFKVSKIEVEKGWAAILLKDFISAEKHFGNAYILEPTNINIWKDLAFTYLNLNEFEHVIEFCDKVLIEDLLDVNCFDQRGTAFYKLGMNEKALQDGLNAQKIRPYICREYNLGMYYAGIGDIKTAKKIIDGITERDNNFLLTCWSPLSIIEPPSNIENFDICLFNFLEEEAFCRSIKKNGWWREIIE